MVVDESGLPIDSLKTEITSNRGKVFLPNDLYPPDIKGKYWLMDDAYAKDFSTRPTTIIFKGSKGSVSV